MSRRYQSISGDSVLSIHKVVSVYEGRVGKHEQKYNVYKQILYGEVIVERNLVRRRGGTERIRSSVSVKVEEVEHNKHNNQEGHKKVKGVKAHQSRVRHGKATSNSLYDVSAEIGDS